MADGRSADRPPDGRRATAVVEPEHTMSGRVNELKQGELVAARFRVTREIGRGGHGIVYEAQDTLLGRNVALKTLRPACADADTFTPEREACLLSSVDSPYVGAIYDLVRDGETVILVMELVQGPTLGMRIQAGPLPWREVAILGVQLARGLKALHGAGIVHRDIKPSNIRLSSGGVLKILDLGVGRWLPADARQAAESLERFVVGTVPYMSPEQQQGCPADARSDIYACGSVLYEMATGVRRVNAPRRQQVGRGESASPVPPRTLMSDLPAWLDRAITRAIEADPDRRFQTARDLLAALLAGLHRSRLLDHDLPVVQPTPEALFAAYANSPVTAYSSQPTATVGPVVWGEYWK